MERVTCKSLITGSPECWRIGWKGGIEKAKVGETRKKVDVCKGTLMKEGRKENTKETEDEKREEGELEEMKHKTDSKSERVDREERVYEIR